MPFPHIPMAPGCASVAGLTHTSLLQPPRGLLGPPGDPGNEVRDWPWPCCGTGVVGRVHRARSETGGAQALSIPPLPHGEVDEDLHHAPMQLTSSAPRIHGALLLPSSLLSFQQVIVLFLGIMS